MPIDLLLYFDIIYVARYYPDTYSLPTADLSHCACLVNFLAKIFSRISRVPYSQRLVIEIKQIFDLSYANKLV